VNGSLISSSAGAAWARCALARCSAPFTAAVLVPRSPATSADPGIQALLGRYATAFENADVAGLIRLLRDDAVFEMPPIPTWYAGREPIGRFLAARVLLRPGDFRLLPAAANGQAAFAAYRREKDGVHRAHGVCVLTVTPSGLSRVVSFNDPGLFATFGLPESVPAIPAPYMYRPPLTG
jgi:RNA polymerase sigma-70 factor (ECF subfamily)